MVLCNAAMQQFQRVECRYDNGSTPSTLETALQEFFPDDLAQWLLKEMQQNRNRALESQKVLNAAYLCAIILADEKQLALHARACTLHFYLSIDKTSISTLLDHEVGPSLPLSLTIGQGGIHLLHGKILRAILHMIDCSRSGAAEHMLVMHETDPLCTRNATEQAALWPTAGVSLRASRSCWQ